MWRRVFSWQLQHRVPKWGVITSRSLNSSASPSATTSFQQPTTLFSDPELLSKRVEDFMPIATGHEREELEAQLQGRNILELNYPIGPFGTKEAPAIVKSVYDKRIVGCPGGEGEDEHDVVWFWLEKGKPHECPVCSQCFKVARCCWAWRTS
ncbi:cytochrome c oxidase subunit 5b-1, mitochondrial-like isoform X2 [Lycium ferocissimum]|uniref:cytochrome c oxidase subunit 5b-1, mitochondrial-like isoform X2 n=1 Tax=Lycium ferocissimum TaxID=112874 RepID=UPI002815DD65|nr:cytochrome c oxidase subunit 5b-1, mitochondrial-like isoform X2 [Lycium ferocissimum]